MVLTPLPDAGVAPTPAHFESPPNSPDLGRAKLEKIERIAGVESLKISKPLKMTRAEVKAITDEECNPEGRRGQRRL
jgi:hypothetical protein